MLAGNSFVSADVEHNSQLTTEQIFEIRACKEN